MHCAFGFDVAPAPMFTAPSTAATSPSASVQENVPSATSNLAVSSTLHSGMRSSHPTHNCLTKQQGRTSASSRRIVTMYQRLTKTRSSRKARRRSGSFCCRWCSPGLELPRRRAHQHYHQWSRSSCTDCTRASCKFSRNHASPTE